MVFLEQPFDVLTTTNPNTLPNVLFSFLSRPNVLFLFLSTKRPIFIFVQAKPPISNFVYQTSYFYFCLSKVLFLFLSTKDPIFIFVYQTSYFYSYHVSLYSFQTCNTMNLNQTRKNCFRYLKLMSSLNAAICTTISYTL